jgi:hypothetical protein
MRTALFILLSLSFQGVSAQLNQKFVEKKEGSYSYAYHKNGKISTEEFRTNNTQYMAQGYAKAFDNTGVEIYNQPVSRSGMLSSVQFSYYENGAVKSADYSSHPDAGIQWYRKISYFDESGKITSESELSHDMHATIQVPDSVYQRMEDERKLAEQQKHEEKLKQEKEKYSKDSAAFYVTIVEQLEDGTVSEFIPDAEHGKREQVITRKGKIIKTTTEFFIKTPGIQSITRTYFKNGRIHEEYTYEEKIWHYREYDQKGRIVQEILNNVVVAYE